MCRQRAREPGKKGTVRRRVHEVEKVGLTGRRAGGRRHGQWREGRWRRGGKTGGWRRRRRRRWRGERTGVEDAWRRRKAAAVEKRAVDGDGQRCSAQCAVRWPSVIRTKRVVPCDVPGSLAPLLGRSMVRPGQGRSAEAQKPRPPAWLPGCLARWRTSPAPSSRAGPARSGASAHPSDP